MLYTNLFLLKLFEMEIPTHVISIIVVTIVIIGFIVLVNIKLETADPLGKPKGVVFVAEMFVTGINGLVESIMGKKFKNFAPYIGFLAIYLALSNTIGLFSLTPPTSSISVTATLGVITFILIHTFAIKNKGVLGHLKSFLGPIDDLLSFAKPVKNKVTKTIIISLILFLSAFFFVLNVVGELAVPVSISFRLFGNVLAGSIITGMLHVSLASSAFGFGTILYEALILVAHSYFDIVSGIIQTIVFVLLTSIFIANASD